MDSAAPPLTVVVPCYNEAARLDELPLLAFLDGCAEASLLFVDDGSTDATAARLTALAARRPARIEVLSLRPNGGKAEAVRRGMLLALGRGPGLVGYLDADLSTPPNELLRLRAAFERPGVDAVLGARVALLGTDIERSAFRHYLGRVFASAAAIILQARVYDTQCGAKLFRASPALDAALATPFISRWAFDVELLGRLLTGGPASPPLPLAAIVEVPLATWHDVGGSKLGPLAMARTLAELGRIGLDLAARRRQGKPAGLAAGKAPGRTAGLPS
ncbi:MAG TPA: glycosyltransferase [Polyangia bacterium]|jgi:glycosyltransferase involved in cell wall biosynthesis|nr:glycosyltransferase [Polyangia bacterium]